MKAFAIYHQREDQLKLKTKVGVAEENSLLSKKQVFCRNPNLYMSDNSMCTVEVPFAVTITIIYLIGGACIATQQACTMDYPEPTRNSHPPHFYRPSGWPKKKITNHTSSSDACMHRSIFNQSSFNMVYFYSVILIADHSWKIRFTLVTHYDVTTQGGVYNSVVWYRDIILWAWFPRRCPKIQHAHLLSDSTPVKHGPRTPGVDLKMGDILWSTCVVSD